jgi:hypothetical protein
MNKEVEHMENMLYYLFAIDKHTLIQELALQLCDKENELSLLLDRARDCLE